jgi:lysophospholipase L1-like esterase
MDQFYGARARGLALPPLFSDLARARRCGFLDAGTLMQVSPQDGVHFEAEAHAALAQGVARALGDLASG